MGQARCCMMRRTARQLTRIRGLRRSVVMSKDQEDESHGCHADEVGGPRGMWERATMKAHLLLHAGNV